MKIKKKNVRRYHAGFSSLSSITMNPPQRINDPVKKCREFHDHDTEKHGGRKLVQILTMIGFRDSGMNTSVHVLYPDQKKRLLSALEK
jgi:hypothetical protein